MIIVIVWLFCFFYKTGLRGPARHEVSPWARAWAEGQARGPLRHDTAGTRAKSARHATARAWPEPGPCRPGPARGPSIGLGSSSSAGFGAFEKIKCIFSIAPIGSLEKSRECFHRKNTHRVLASEASDNEPARPVYFQFLAQVSSAFRTYAPDAGQTLFARPVVPDISSKLASVF